MKNNQIVGLLVAAVVIVGAIIYLSKDKVGPSNTGLPAADVMVPSEENIPVPEATSTPVVQSAKDRIAAKSEQFDKAKEISNPSGFVNTDGKPITLSQYVGKKVILLDIMTYSCINCIRTFPYLVDWYKKYEDKGLIIIGIHTPEFDFEKNIDNVKAAMAKYGIEFPVVLDNDYGTWNAYNNRYWPMKYLIDIDGFVRYTHIGEGGYSETEEQIQSLLKERADVLGLSDSAKTSVDMPPTVGAVEQSSYIQSPETYFGSDRNEFFGNGTVGTPVLSQTYAISGTPQTSHFYLDGTWMIARDHAENISVPAKIVYPFSAKHVYFVASADNPVDVRITVDGKPLGKQKGADVSEKDGVDTVTIHESRLYDLYSGASAGIHTLEIVPQAKGLKAFTLTFGN